MKTLFSLILVLMFPLVTSAWTGSWESIKQSAKTIESVSADFRQEKHLKILTKPLLSKGKFIFQKPGSLRWEYQTPISSILLSHNGNITRYFKQDGKLVQDSGEQLQAMQIVLQEIIAWLGGRFDENPDFTATLKPQGKIILEANKKELLDLVSRIELHMSDCPGIIDSVYIYESENAFTLLKFIKPELNKHIEQSYFQKP